MNFNARSRAVGTHRRVVFHYSYVERLYERETLEKAFCHPAGDMLDETGRDSHLTAHHLVHISIIERMAHVVGAHRPGDVVSGTHRHRIVVAGEPLLLYQERLKEDIAKADILVNGTLVGMKPHAVDEDISTLVSVHKKVKIKV